MRIRKFGAFGLPSQISCLRALQPRSRSGSGGLVVARATYGKAPPAGLPGRRGRRRTPDRGRACTSPLARRGGFIACVGLNMPPGSSKSRGVEPIFVHIGLLLSYCAPNRRGNRGTWRARPKRTPIFEGWTSTGQSGSCLWILAAWIGRTPAAFSLFAAMFAHRCSDTQGETKR